MTEHPLPYCETCRARVTRWVCRCPDCSAFLGHLSQAPPVIEPAPPRRLEWPPLRLRKAVALIGWWVFGFTLGLLIQGCAP